MKRLYYFTDSYPFSVDYTWKSAEIEAAAKQFTEVIIVPFSFKKENAFTFPENVRVVEPTMGHSLYAKAKYVKYLFAKSQELPWLSEFFKALLKGKQAIVAWYLATIYRAIIRKCAVFEELKALEEKETSVLFFQWTMNNALLIPLLKKWGFSQIICRMHGFDLYEFRHGNYLPYKAAILKATTNCTFISEHGKEYAQKKYPFIKAKSQVHYLGAKPMSRNTLDVNQKFHLLSISRVVPLKRLHLIVEALKKSRTPIRWTHIGDGADFDELKEKSSSIREVNSTSEVEFLGWLSPKGIASFFSQNGINALILVSETEGLPVVIMEAFSAGIPVIATNVGGVSELVTQKNGVLLRSNPEIAEISAAIDGLANESSQEKKQRSDEAYRAYSKSFDLDKNSKTFINFLAKQCQ